jgi:seryl-tRNA synthetase
MYALASALTNQAKGDATELIAKKTVLEKQKKEIEEDEKVKREALEKKVNTVGNVVHPTVPVSNNEVYAIVDYGLTTFKDDNQLLTRWYPDGKPPEIRDNVLSHHEVLYRLGGFEQDPRGVKVVGHRGYFLINYGVRLNLALIQYGLDFLTKKSYTPIQTPFFMNKDVMAKTAQLEDFDEQLYKVSDSLE